MRLRELRRADAPRLFELLKSQFPEEESILGTRADGFARIVRRLYRPDLRLLLGLLRLVGRSPFRFFVIEEEGDLVATTLLSFPPKTGFLSMVVVAPAFRRRGYARRLLDTARTATVRRGRRFVALNVLGSNAPARTLYASAGYRELDHQWLLVHDRPIDLAAAPKVASVRPFQREDAGAVAELANRTMPAAAREVLPARPADYRSRTLADRLFDAEAAAWVVDRGRGIEGHLSAVVSPATEAAHLSCPLVAPSLDPELAEAMVRTAGAWLAARTPVRIATSVPEGRPQSRRALEGAGFHAAYDLFTLGRSST